MGNPKEVRQAWCTVCRAWFEDMAFAIEHNGGWCPRHDGPAVPDMVNTERILLCDKCNKPIEPGARVEFIGADPDQLIVTHDDVLIIHHKCPEVENG